VSGTVATYQGFPCRAVTFRRTRGWRADTSSVLLFAADFPHGFEFVVPDPGGFARLRLITQSSPDLSAIRGRRRRPKPLPQQRRLNFAGDLVMAEVDQEGREYVVVVDPLFCVSLETVKRNANGAIAIVRARLVDPRFFYAHGFLRRWSFNRTDAEANYSLDSVKEGGDPFTLGEIAKEAASNLFLTPTLAHYPSRWDEGTPEVEFARFSSATAAMVRLSQEHGTDELCLNFDGTVALWEPGDGKVGYAPEGKGAGNEQAFPQGLQVYLQGTGQSRGVEATYPPDYVVVVGGLRVATVRMDELDPVLVIDNAPVPLNEETVRKLTNGKFGLAWLNKFVLAPQAYQNHVALDPRVVALLREQAYRLWRLPDVEREVQPKGEQQAKAQPKQGPITVKGPNANLLPLRARAETSAGKRLPVRIDSYRFASVHRAMAPSEETQKIATIQKQLRDLKRQIKAQAHKAAKPDPWNTTEAFFLFNDKYVSPRLLYGITGAQAHGVSYEQFQGMVSRARLIDRIGEVSPGLASQYESQLSELFGVEQGLGGFSKTLFDLAKEAVAFEKEVADSRDMLETPDEEARERAEELRNKVQDELRAIDRQRQDQGIRDATGTQKRVKRQTAVFVRNLPRRVDSGARVYSAELGIVRTSDLCGHVAEEGVPVAEATSFVPKSPLVYFGAVLRPKVDKASRRPTTGRSSANKSQTLIPSVLSDTESYYTAAFKRSAPGRAEQIELGAVPKGEGIPLDRPDLVELVPLEGQSNRFRLDDTAQSVAEGVFKRAERVEAAKYSIARPWPVNCDGVVSGVEIVMRPNGKGFITTILTGSASEVLEGLGRTRVRVKRGKPSDAAAREGLLP